jgi:hypothetical protein
MTHQSPPVDASKPPRRHCAYASPWVAHVEVAFVVPFASHDGFAHSQFLYVVYCEPQLPLCAVLHCMLDIAVYGGSLGQGPAFPVHEKLPGPPFELVPLPQPQMIAPTMMETQTLTAVAFIARP